MLEEALGKKPSVRSPAIVPPALKGMPQSWLQLAPAGSGATQTWRSRRAKYAHLPPITVTLCHGGKRAEVRVDECARAGDLTRDLVAGGPGEGLLEQLDIRSARLSTPRTTPRGVLHRVTGLLKKGAPMHVRTVLDEGGEYEVAATERELIVGSMEELMVGAPMRALGLGGDDSSDWSDDPDAEAV